MPPSQQLTIEQAISLAEKAARQGNVAVARQLYNAVLQHQSNHPIATQGLRVLQRGTPHQQQSLQAQTANPPPDQINALINLYQSGQMTKAEQACNELMQAYPPIINRSECLRSSVRRSKSVKDSSADIR